MLDVPFRLNPLFSITTVDDLTESQKRSFRRILSGGNVYSMLHAPREANFTVKALNRVLSDFLELLIEPKRICELPGRYRESYDRDMEQLIIQMVLDGVLEIESSGVFISGVEAFNTLISESSVGESFSDEVERGGYIQRITTGAIDYAIRSLDRNPRHLAWNMYNFNRIPLNRKRRRQLPDEQSVLEFLGLEENGTWNGMSPDIKPVIPASDENGELPPFHRIWRSWKFRSRKSTRDRNNYKIYISPLPDETPDVFRIVRERVAESGATGMKIGRMNTAILRPDKLLVYFLEIDRAMEFAEELVRRTSSFEGQGAPFTYQVDRSNRLISMGVDPPKKFGMQNSWRMYVTEKTALAIQGAHRAKTDNIIEYIRSHMRAFGVNAREWKPVNRDWTMEFDLSES